MPPTDIALRKSTTGLALRENGLEFRFYKDVKAGVRFIGRVRGTNARIGISLGRIRPPCPYKPPESWAKETGAYARRALIHATQG